MSFISFKTGISLITAGFFLCTASSISSYLTSREQGWSGLAIAIIFAGNALGIIAGASGVLILRKAESLRTVPDHPLPQLPPKLVPDISL